MKCYKNIIVIICFFVFACVKVAWADSYYTITFNTGNNSNTSCDGGNTACSSIVTSESGRYVDGVVDINTRYAYANGEFGLRLNKAKKYSGYIKMPLSTQGQVTPTYIVISAKKYGNDPNSNLTVNGVSVQITSTEFENYTFNITTSPITYIELLTETGTSNNNYRLWIQSIKVYYGSGASHTLSSAVDPAASGSVSLSATTVSEGGTATATATPEDGYDFSYWTITGTDATLSSTTDNPTTITMGTSDATVTAHFEALHTLSSAVSPAAGGSVSLSATSLAQGGTSTATATPNLGYTFSSWSISGGATLSSTSTNPTTVTMGNANATVTANFAALASHTVTYNAGSGTCTPSSETSACVVLPEATPSLGCYSFFGWATSLVSETSTAPSIVGTAGDTYCPIDDITLYAVYATNSGNYTKVTSNLSDWSGQYLIVYEEGLKAFDGSLATLDATNNNISVTITGSTIESTSATDASLFTIAKTGGNYTIMSASGYYIGQTSDANNMMASTSDAYTNSIAYNTDHVDIISSGGAYLRFNNTSGQYRFRYYKSSTYTGQQAIQLYRAVFSYSTNPSCCPPTNFSASGITSYSANLSWTAGGSETTWQVVVSETELANPSTGTIHNVATTSYVASGLSPLTTYYAYVRASCGGGEYSSWRQVLFTTKCVPLGISLNHTSETLSPSHTLALVVSGTTSPVTWNSSNPSVATVSSSGTVTAVAEGYCVITATLEASGSYCGEIVSCNIHVASDDCTRIGWGTTTPTYGAGGAYEYSSTYPYSYVQLLYSADEIRMAGGVAGKINSIKFHHTSTSANVSSCKIYMGITDKNELSDGWVPRLTQLFYSGAVTYNGWTEITLNTPYEWDGESNIIIAINNLTQTSGDSFYCHSINSNISGGSPTIRCRYYYTNSAIELTDGIPSASGSTTSNRVNTKFCITACDNPVDAYFNDDAITLPFSGTVNLATMLTVNPTGGTITYSSSNPTVATVSSSGVVTASASTEGTTEIAVHVAQTAGGNCAANASITVKVCDCASGMEQYEIGTSSNAGRSYGPVDNEYKYSYRQIIYNKDELAPGTINSIAFNYEDNTPITNLNNVTIYMGSTNKSEFSSTTDWIAIGSLTQVYSGNLNCSQGWNKFTLTTPFVYNGCDNLVVAIDDNSDSYNVSACDFYYSGSYSDPNCQIYYKDDSSNPDPNNPPTASSLSSYYPDIKFCMTESSLDHVLTYDVTGNCAGGEVTPATIPSATATYTTVSTITPSCSLYAGFTEWNTAADGSGTSYQPGDRINLACGDITLHAIYENVVTGSSSCENAVAFCNSGGLSFAVEEGYGQYYGDFCNYFYAPGTWWYMQIEQPGDIEMMISSTAGDVDFACWGPFDNKTCNLSDISDAGANGWEYYSDVTHHYSNTATSASTHDPSTPICGTYTLARPSGNLVDYGGSASAVEYLQIVGAEAGKYYMILVGNYQNGSGVVTFTQTGGSGRTSCDIVTNCDITSISATTTCTSTTTYDVSGEIAFRDAPVDGTLTVTIGGSAPLTFTPPFSSPISYSKTGLSANGEDVTITATFTSSTINCSKTASYTAPTKVACGFDPLPVELLNLHASCNGKRALVTWTTASERNNDYFVVERSDDAVNFVEVGRVAGAGNSIEMLSYNYADYSIRTGDNYYRLTQVDYDGTRTTSEIIEVHCSGNVPLGDPDVYVYPNPFGDELTVHLVNFGDVAAHIQVYDMLGRMLFERTADDTEVVLQLGALPDAAYTVRVSTTDFVVNKKVVKNK